MNSKWLIRKTPDVIQVETLKKELNVSETVAYMLVQRGITTFDEAKTFFRGTLKELHDPFLMKDMKKAVNRINKAIKNHEKILIYGDYDVDGTTAVSLVYMFLSNYTSFIDYYIPNRYAEGYGISEKGILTAKDNNINLIIALDCGIMAHKMIDLANSFSIDVIVCDHHTPGEKLPEAIVLNPKREDCEYPYKELSGCGVGFKLLQALVAENNWDEEFLFSFLDLVAISIAADIVTVTGENRLLAQFGLKKINDGKNFRLGIDTLLKLAKKEKPLTLTDVVFIIAPRINAAGRLDDAKKIIQLFVSKNDMEVKKIAQNIHQLNEERRHLDKKTTEDALEIIKDIENFEHKCTTVVYNKNWHKGVVGIVASRLIESYYRPTVVLTFSEEDDLWTGSARSIKDIDIFSILKNCHSLIEKFGGHQAAAGLSIKTEHLKEFIQVFEKEVRKMIGSETLIPEQIIEKELEFGELFNLGESVMETPRFIRVLKQFEPHGPGNMKPLFLAKNVFAVNPQLLKGEHLKMKVIQPEFNQAIDAIYFNATNALELIKENNAFDMVFTLSENEFRGRTTPQLIVKDLRRHL